MIKRALFIAAAPLALSSCATLTSEEDVASAVAESLPSLPETWAVKGASPGEVRLGWIEAVGDPVLSELVLEAQANNPDIRAALANLEAASALVRQARAPLFPQVNANFNADRTRSPDPFAFDRVFYQGLLQARWEVDLWGRVRAGRSAAYASAQAVEAELLFAQYSLAAGVASAYFASIEATEQVGVAQRTVDALAEIDRIVRVRYREGFASRQDTATTGADLQSARDSLEQARNAQRNARRALEVLLGRYPAEAVALGAMIIVDRATAWVLAAMIFLQNVPEAYAAVRALLQNHGMSRQRLLLIFSGLALLGPICAVAGLIWLADAPGILGGIMVFAAGGVLYLIFEDVAPEASDRVDRRPPLGAVAGFALGLAGHLIAG